MFTSTYNIDIINSLLLERTIYMTPQNLLDYCIDEIKHLNSGDIFSVRDLFKGYEWSRYPLALRITLGTLFLNYASNSDTVKPLEKTKQGQQRYERLQNKEELTDE